MRRRPEPQCGPEARLSGRATKPTEPSPDATSEVRRPQSEVQHPRRRWAARRWEPANSPTVRRRQRVQRQEPAQARARPLQAQPGRGSTGPRRWSAGGRKRPPGPEGRPEQGSSTLASHCGSCAPDRGRRRGRTEFHPRPQGEPHKMSGDPLCRSGTWNFFLQSLNRRRRRRLTPFRQNSRSLQETPLKP